MEANQNFSKEPWLAVVLSLCWTGIGQIYAGRIPRGIILILVEATLIFLLHWSQLIPRCDILVSVALVLAAFVVCIWNLFDAHKCARTANSQDFEFERKQSKDPWLALFLSDLIPGLGHLYLRKWLFGILFIIAGGFMLITEREYPLLCIGLWAFIATSICFHSYILAPVRREKTKRKTLIICVVILGLRLSGYDELLYKAYVVEAFRIPTPVPFNWIPPEQQWGDR